ncbi:hypothetical protein KL920_002595 [Ogataea angusta]|nr:hypothetical protein KL920_002595 [Ogataea angusta]
MVKYESLVLVGTFMVISSVSFILGVLFSNWPYDYYTLWDTTKGQEFFDAALEHYKVWGQIPPIINYTFHFVIAIAFVGSFIKIFKPSEDVQYFEYGTLGALVIAVCVYVSNVKVGIMSCIAGEWGEVDQNTGLGVIAASETMIVFILLGVVLLQGGLFYAFFEDARLKQEFYLKDLKERYEATAEQAAPVEAKSSGAEAKKTKAKATKKA